MAMQFPAQQIFLVVYYLILLDASSAGKSSDSFFSGFRERIRHGALIVVDLQEGLVIVVDPEPDALRLHDVVHYEAA
jgi:hypothetical protein